MFLCSEPLRGWRRAVVMERRTRRDWAQVIRDLVDIHCPTAERIVLVQDNLNTHTLGSLYEAFPPEEAGGWPKSWSCITPPGTGVGGTWRRSN